MSTSSAAERPARRPIPLPSRGRPETEISSGFPTPLTSFVGRTRELEQVRAQLCLDEVRLLTLTGPGGVGKSRLALAAASLVSGAFLDGIWYIALDTVTDPGAVPSTISRVLGIREAADQLVVAAIKAHLRPRDAMLVLDNLEQVVRAASFIADLLTGCPTLTILATSRERLCISGEREFVVPPLAVPAGDGLPPWTELERCESVALFVERTRALRSDFVLTDANAAAVAEICRRLDGLPLAIELAAARGKLLPPSALLMRLSNRLDMLTGGPRDQPARLQTMRNAIVWSYDLLHPAAQALFRRLSVFTGGCTLEAAEAVATAAGDGDHFSPRASSSRLGIFDGVTELVDHSLLRHLDQGAGEPRLQMLETIRDYGLEQLETYGEADSTRQCHATYFLTLAEETAPELTGIHQTAALHRLEAEHDNLRAALGWFAATGQTERLSRLAWALWRFWLVRGYLHEGRNWLEVAADRAHDDGAAADSRANALYGAAWLAFEQGDISSAVAHGDESLVVARERGDLLEQARALSVLGIIAHRQTDYAQARRLLGEALTCNREIDDRDGVAGSLNNLGILALESGNLGEAIGLFSEAVSAFRDLANQRGIAHALDNLGVVVYCQGDFERAEALSREALDLFRDLGDKRGTAIALDHLGKIARRQGDPLQSWAAHREALPLRQALGDQRGLVVWLEAIAALLLIRGHPEPAARILGAAEALRKRTGLPHLAHELIEHEQIVCRTLAAIGEPAFAANWAAGQSLTVEAAIAEAEAVAAKVVAEPDESATGASSLPRPFGLTPRELDVLRLLARRWADREIADALYISPRTVARHVAGIFNKLGVHSRREAVVVAAKQGLD